MVWLTPVVKLTKQLKLSLTRRKIPVENLFQRKNVYCFERIITMDDAVVLLFHNQTFPLKVSSR